MYPKAVSLDRYFLFTFVNDIDTVVSSHIQKFAVDCKFYRSVPTAKDIEDIYFFEVNTKYISSSVLKTSEFS